MVFGWVLATAVTLEFETAALMVAQLAFGSVERMDARQVFGWVEN